MKILAILTQFHNGKITFIDASIMYLLQCSNININKIYVSDEYSSHISLDNNEAMQEFNKFIAKNINEFDIILSTQEFKPMLLSETFDLIKYKKIIYYDSWALGLEHINPSNSILYTFTSSLQLGLTFYYKYGHSQIYLSEIENLKNQSLNKNIDIIGSLLFISFGFTLGYIFA